MCFVLALNTTGLKRLNRQSSSAGQTNSSDLSRCPAPSPDQPAAGSAQHQTLSYVRRLALGPQIEHRPQLLARLQLAVKLGNCSPFAVDRDILDQLRQLGREVRQEPRPNARFGRKRSLSAAPALH